MNSSTQPPLKLGNLGLNGPQSRPRMERESLDPSDVEELDVDEVDLDPQEDRDGLKDPVSIVSQAALWADRGDRPTIMVIDDDRATVLTLKRILQQQPTYQVECATHSRAAWQDLSQRSFDALPNLIICDWAMPELSGLDICRRVKAHPLLKVIYFILLTARNEVQDRVQGLNTGADEFLAKPTDPDELHARVRAGLRLQQLTLALVNSSRRLQARNELLESLSLTDPLTGVLNRRALDQALPALLHQVGPRPSQARYRYLCLMVLDLDHFKAINDTHGHLIGDLVLKVVVGRLQNTMRPSSLLYRFGGEEFVSLTPGLNFSRSQLHIEELRACVCESPISTPAGTQIPITISIGGVVVSDHSLIDAQSVLDQADQALYAAKQAGRNRTRLVEFEQS